MPDANPLISPLPCPICAQPRREVGTRVFMAVHAAKLDFCGACGFLQVRDPHWLAQAYGQAITALDTGLVRRNLHMAAALEGLLPALSSARGIYLDQGGGVGLLVRLMRDRGFDFRWADAHAENLLTRGFELAPGESCVAATAIEVLEHLQDPLEFVARTLAEAGTRTLIFTTELYAGDPPGDWWYYAEEAGQHIAFYRHDTLVAIGQRLGLRLYSHGGLHMLTDRAISPFAFRWRLGRFGRLVARLGRRLGRSARPSLVEADHAALLQRMRHGVDATRP